MTEKGKEKKQQGNCWKFSHTAFFEKKKLRNPFSTVTSLYINSRLFPSNFRDENV